MATRRKKSLRDIVNQYNRIVELYNQNPTQRNKEMLDKAHRTRDEYELNIKRQKEYKKAIDEKHKLVNASFDAYDSGNERLARKLRGQSEKMFDKAVDEKYSQKAYRFGVVTGGKG